VVIVSQTPIKEAMLITVKATLGNTYLSNKRVEAVTGTED
jgi:hypothetical protein